MILCIKPQGERVCRGSFSSLASPIPLTRHDNRVEGLAAATSVGTDRSSSSAETTVVVVRGNHIYLLSNRLPTPGRHHHKSNSYQRFRPEQLSATSSWVGTVFSTMTLRRPGIPVRQSQSTFFLVFSANLHDGFLSLSCSCYTCRRFFLRCFVCQPVERGFFSNMGV